MSNVPPNMAAQQHGASGVQADAERRAEVERKMDAERVATLFEITPTPLMAGLLFAMVVAIIMWPYRSGMLILAWLLAKFIIAGLRLRDVHRFRQLGGERRDVALWQRRAVTMFVIDGLCWGAMGLIFMPEQSPGVQTVILASLIGIAGTGVFSFICNATGCFLFLATVLLPSVGFQALLGTDAGWFATLGILIYQGLMCIEARRGEERIKEMLRLRFENALIADERHRALLLAEHSSAAKSRFLATVSHEMRTPLNGIMGMTQLLQRSPVTPEQSARLETIHGSSKHLQAVIGDLLDLSRIEFGKLTLDERPLLLEGTLREVTDLLGAVARDKGLHFHVEVGAGIAPWVLGDASRIKQVLHNLIGNAIKFTMSGDVVVRVEACAGQLRFTVRDTGDGIAPEALPLIFDAFEQGPAAMVHARSGTGLGLTISRRIARALGGDVVCESGCGPGATFAFTLPLRPVQAPAAEPADTARCSERRMSGNILVVDDNPVNAMVASAMLESMGLHTQVAEDGKRALGLMESGSYDLVLMDCQLPGMDGWEATRRWRHAERGRERLPIVAFTANAVVGDREQCLAAGMDDYLAKPFQMEQLVDVLARNMKVARTG